VLIKYHFSAKLTPLCSFFPFTDTATMRRSHTDTEAKGIDINLTPMLDMVFIMLIFFIVTASFTQEAGVEVERPSAQTAEAQERVNISVSIDKQKGVWLDKQPVDIRHLRAMLSQRHAENPEGSVIVIADKHTKTGLLIEVIDQIRLAGIEDVSIAAQGE